MYGKVTIDIKKWLDSPLLTLNAAKTKFISFSSTKTRKPKIARTYLRNTDINVGKQNESN